MQGLRAIQQLNTQRFHESVVAAEAKADAARKQNHPNTAEFEAKATELRAEYEATKH